MSTQNVSPALIKALGLPKYTRSLRLTVAVDQAPEIRATFFPTDAHGKLLLNGDVIEILARHYVLVANPDDFLVGSYNVDEAIRRSLQEIEGHIAIRTSWCS